MGRKSEQSDTTLVLHSDGVTYELELSSEGDIGLKVDVMAEAVYMDRHVARVLAYWLLSATDNYRPGA